MIDGVESHFDHLSGPTSQPTPISVTPHMQPDYERFYLVLKDTSVSENSLGHLLEFQVTFVLGCLHIRRWREFSPRCTPMAHQGSIRYIVGLPSW